MAPTRTCGSAIGAPRNLPNFRKGKKHGAKTSTSTTESSLEQQSDPLRATSDVLVEDRSVKRRCRQTGSNQTTAEVARDPPELVRSLCCHPAARAKDDKKMESRLRKMVSNKSAA
ncbi:Ribosome biogenesis protein NOP53 [Pseudozyma hubeiensis]|nr:Ribosome biogenesis protein NOP53 [Pseudozyma hubeiensis]